MPTIACLSVGPNPLVDPPEAIAGIPNVEFLNFPGTDSNQIVPDSFKSPATDEISIGVSKRLGTKGVFRADLVRREWENFYSDRTDLSTGQVLLEGNPADLTHIGNFGDDVLKREYLGLHTQATYRFNENLQVSATYTLSQLEGNIDGEMTQNATISVDPNSYPEYLEPRWRFPVGDLGADQFRSDFIRHAYIKNGT